MRIHFSLALVAVSTGCLTRNIPPPETPAQVVPTVDNPPPQVDGQGQVSIDSVGGPARVEAVLATETWSGSYVAGSSIRTAPVCTTPCVANLPYGSVQLRFTSVHDDEYQSIDTINIGKKPSAYRYAIGRTNSNMALLIAGVSIATMGGVGVLSGAIVAGVSGDDAAGAVIGGGVVLGVVGAVLWALGRTDVQPGNGTQWTLPEGAQ